MATPASPPASAPRRPGAAAVRKHVRAAARRELPGVPPPERALQRRLARVRILCCDVDGVLTDGRLLIGAAGEFKSFHILDGMGLRLLQGEGIRVAWISSRPSTSTQRRADVGDDLVDLGPMQRAGVAIAVANGVAEVRSAARYVTRLAGGHGAVREVAEMILRAQGRWARVVREQST